MHQNHFFAMLSRMKYINRWGLMRNTRTENISEHSGEVALLSHALAVIGNTYFEQDYNPERAALLGLYHDVPEIFTGDLPTPVKYHNPAIRAAYKAVEDSSRDKLLASLPAQMQPFYQSLLCRREEDAPLLRLVHAADKLSAYIKCMEEEKAGNKEFIKAGDSLLKILKELAIPEADYFMAHFLQSYKLTLDEQE